MSGFAWQVGEIDASEAVAFFEDHCAAAPQDVALAVTQLVGATVTGCLKSGGVVYAVCGVTQTSAGFEFWQWLAPADRFTPRMVRALVVTARAWLPRLAARALPRHLVIHTRSVAGERLLRVAGRFAVKDCPSFGPQGLVTRWIIRHEHLQEVDQEPHSGPDQREQADRGHGGR
jgi:hypothetical protein